MSAFDGKWKRVSATNVDELIAASGVTGDKAATLKTFLTDADVVEDMLVTDAGTTRKLYVNGELKRDVGSLFGKPQERETMLGKSTLLGKKVSDTRIEVSQKAPGRPDSSSVITVDGNTMHVDYTIGSITCRRTYAKQ